MVKVTIFTLPKVKLYPRKLVIKKCCTPQIVKAGTLLPKVLYMVNCLDAIWVYFHSLTVWKLINKKNYDNQKQYNTCSNSYLDDKTLMLWFVKYITAVPGMKVQKDNNSMILWKIKK